MENDMGGNVAVIDSHGNEIRADRIDFNTMRHSHFIDAMRAAFVDISLRVKDISDEFLWGVCHEALYNGFAFNGSSADVFGEWGDVSSMGDIDLTVPVTLKRELWNVLDAMDSILTPRIQYIGSNRPNYTDGFHQINTIFRYFDAAEKSHYVQVDFEFVEYVDGFPTEFSRFAHSSTWVDREQGIKGVHHKYLLRSLFGAMSRMEDVVIATPASTADKLRLSSSKVHHNPRMLKFSVDRGVRAAYAPLCDNDGVTVKIDGRTVMKPIPVVDSHYTTNLDQMFNMLFDFHASDRDIVKMWSFTGLLQLMDEFMTHNEIIDALERLVDLYWGKNAQGLVRDDKVADHHIKMAGYGIFIDEFKAHDMPLGRWAVIKDEYYTNYESKSVDD